MALLLAFVAAGCGHAWAPLDMSALPGAGDFPNDHLVVLAGDSSLAYAWDPDAAAPYYTDDRMVRIRILTETGRARLARYSIDYDAELGGLDAVRARIVKPSGAQIVVDGFEDRPATPRGGVLHTSGRVLDVDLSAAAPNDVVEIRWRARSEVLFQPFTFTFGGDYPVVRSRVRVRDEPGLEVASRFTELGAERAFPPAHAEDEGSRWLVWERTDYRPLRGRFRYLPPRTLVNPTLRVALRAVQTPSGVQRFFNRWADYGPWYRSLAHGTDAVTPAVRANAERSLEGAPPDPQERLRRLLRHIQDDVRYVAIELGIGGWRPASADEVAASRFGDCKGMATYLKALLGAERIDSAMVIVATRNAFAARAPDANLRAANHVILAVDLPGVGRTFVDPTCSTCPLGRLPWYDEDVDVIVVGAGDAEVVRTPGGDAASNRSERDYRVTIGPNGDATFALTFATTGEVAIATRRTLRGDNPSERHDAVQRWAFGDAHGTVERFEVQALGDLDAPLVVTASGTVSALADGTERSRALAASDLASPPLPPLAPARPALDAYFDYPATWVVTLDAALPHHELSWLAPPVALETAFGSYHRTVTRTPGGVRIARALVLSVRTVAAADLPALDAFLGAARRHDAEGIVLAQRSAGVTP